MTFLEAAFEVLRREGRPLHFKDLTRLALKYDLLSVVGRDPEEMMQSRLQAEARRPSTDLVRVSPGVFGLRNMPTRTGKGRANTETAATEGSVDESTAAKATESKSPATATTESAPAPGRRRRGGAGKAAGGASAAPAAAPSETAPGEAAVVKETPAATAAAAAPAAPRDSRRGNRRGRDEHGAAHPGRGSAAARGGASAPKSEPATETPAPVAAASPVAAESAVSLPSGESAPAARLEPTPVVEVVAAPPVPVAPVSAGPVAAVSEVRSPPPAASQTPPAPAAPVAPSATESPVAVAVPPPAPPASPSAAAPAAPSAQSPKPAASSNTPPPAPESKPAPSAPQGQPAQRGDGGGPRLMSLADAAYDVLRGSSDTRPLSSRQIAEIALKRRLVRGELADISRALRGALVREQRQRDSEGLRPRMRSLGGGQYALGERKLEPELYTAERDLIDRLSRTREATRVALRRRLRGMPAGPFELLMRLLLERMGIVSAELIKRGEGVAYFGGSISRGSRQLRLLCAIRPGEAEIPREAIGELRAGVRMRGFDEGLLLASARLSSAALSEVNAMPGIDVYDHDALTELLIRNQIGVRRMLLPIEYLDTELFNELTEAN